MSEYHVEIIETSRELDPKTKIRAKDFTNAIKLGTVCETEEQIIDVDSWVHLHVKNEKSDDKEYEAYVIIDKEGNLYHTGSESFWRSFTSIWEEVADYPDLVWKLLVKSLPSKNRQGKTFLTCTLI